jgi:hypothetical protein
MHNICIILVYDIFLLWLVLLYALLSKWRFHAHEHQYCFLKIQFLCIKKFIKFIPWTHTQVLNTRAKFYWRLHNILSYRDRKLRFLSKIYHFCIAQNTTYLPQNFYCTFGICICIYLFNFRIFDVVFKFLKNGSTDANVTKAPFSLLSYIPSYNKI